MMKDNEKLTSPVSDQIDFHALLALGILCGGQTTFDSIKKLIDYRKRMAERIKKVTTEDHIIHGYMIYRCESCGAVYFMNLEKGLEDPIDDKVTGKHKPVPFVITCVLCGGEAEHILPQTTIDTLSQNYRSYNRTVANPDHNKTFPNFFWNDPDSDCGVPILFKEDHMSAMKEDPYEEAHHILLMTLAENPLSSSCLFMKEDELFLEVGVNRNQRRHPEGDGGYKRPRSNKKLYEY